MAIAKAEPGKFMEVGNRKKDFNSMVRAYKQQVEPSDVLAHLLGDSSGAATARWDRAWLEFSSGYARQNSERDFQCFAQASSGQMTSY